ncbi:carbohydrate ABC transporter permease [Microtetraspora sp. AC03309]|uniref:carbohydrate ABC transporter permease n=1 Tax=Microtetraspora sp. AC03309 TaxID=2779376 RepID=UPI001E479716|nr:carbohydrate ABC transporter permease [Microtetraspora sp. AC03309]MCC5578507.1 carbohydrate ABC transporter permease [Microtetraspora sp. AC03309]
MPVAVQPRAPRTAPSAQGGAHSRPRPTGSRARWAKAPLYLLAITMIVPFYWMAITAFKPVSEITRNPPSFIPQSPTTVGFSDPEWNPTADNPGHVAGLFQRFTEVDLGFWRFAINSVVVATAITLLALLTASLAAYVITKHAVRGRKVIFLMILGSMMIPWQATLVPNYLVVRNLGWTDSYLGYIVPAIPKAFVVFFLVQYLQSIPNDLIEAARIDGAGEWRIWWQVVMPLLRPALAAMSIFVMLNEWNNFLWPLIIVESDQMANLPVALARLNSAFTGAQHMGVIMAASLLASLPTVVFFLLFQKHFTRGIAMSGLKG